MSAGAGAEAYTRPTPGFKKNSKTKKNGAYQFKLLEKYFTFMSPNTKEFKCSFSTNVFNQV
jgi:hypothetical protein